MTDFERIKYYYDNGWANIEKVRQYVQYNVINQEEFQIITKEVY